jgi:alkylation response protein AidB-like acyl-CoA dehydrogenase
MDLNYPPEAEAFRPVIRGWLEENLPKGWFEPDFKMTPEERKAFNETWVSKLFEGGWICAGWPKEYGGKGLTLIEQVVLNEEFAEAGAPMRADFFGDTLVGPTILQWGTEEQKKEFIPGILKGEIAWCQGFSEPNSGSDLASLKTSAVLDGDEWVINGQKVWTDAGPARRLRLPLDPHRPRRAEPRGHQLHAGADAPARRRSAPDRAGRRFSRVQRGLLHQTPGARRTTW